MGEMRIGYKTSNKMSEGKRSLARSRSRWKNNTKWILGKQV
jgi:hypothetical protein